MEQIHGHDVIQALKSWPVNSSKADLIALVESKFGNESQFYNCSNDSMSAEQLLSFFEGKGKLKFNESGFSFGKPAGGCNH